MRQLHLLSKGRLAWHDVPDPAIVDPGDAIVRPFLAGRCDGDCLPIHRRVSRGMQAGLRLGLIDPAVGCICGNVPFRGPVAIGHECVAQVVAVGDGVRDRAVGDIVVVPWAISCGACAACRRGLTSKCTTARGDRTLAAYGFGPASGPWGGMISDELRVPFADHLLVPIPASVPPERVAAGSDNLADGWRAVVPALAAQPGASVLVLGGGAQSIGLYAAGLAVAHGASVVDYVDERATRRDLAEALGARPTGDTPPSGAYDVVVEASSTARGLRTAVRATAPGGVCTAVGYYVATGTRVPVMHMYANDATLRVGVSHPRAVLPDLLAFVEQTEFPAEIVTTLTADWEDAPRAYAERTTKVVLRRDPLRL